MKMTFKKRYLILIVLLVSVTASAYYSRNTNPDNQSLVAQIAPVYFHLGENYSHKYQYIEAIQAYEKSLSCDPEFKKADIQFNLGWIYAELRRYDEAIEAYQKAIQYSDANTIAHMNLGMIYIHLNQKAQAMEEYKILKSLDSEKAKALLSMTISFKKTT